MWPTVRGNSGGFVKSCATVDCEFGELLSCLSDIELPEFVNQFYQFSHIIV